MFSQTLHHLVVGLTTGIATLACLCAIAAWVSNYFVGAKNCLLYTSPSPRDKRQSRMPSSA